jgi:replicative DNA helicase
MSIENIKKKFWQEVERGKQVLNEGLHMGFNRLTKVICNVQRGRYDLWVGGTGTGKSSAVLDAYVINPIEYLLANPESPTKIRVKYYNLEMATMPLMAKLMARRVYEQSGGKYLLSVNKIFGRGKYKMSAEEDRLLGDAQDYFDMLTNYVQFVDGNISPLFIYIDLIALANEVGTVDRHDDNYWEFTPNDPNLIVVVVIDHVGLITPNKNHGGSKKAAIDDLSEMLIKFRNKCGFSPVVISQFNRSIESMDRKSNSHPDPQLSDFKDSGNPAQDADTVVALFNPIRHRLTEHNGYDMNVFGSFYRGVSVLKNRDGLDNVDIAMGFIGAVGKMKELPTVEEINSNPEMLKKVLAYFSNNN